MEKIMKEIHPNIFIGNDTDCAKCINDLEFAIVHACKTCHQTALNYTKSLPPSHQNYLIFESGQHLYLNLVDMTQEFQPKYTHPIFDRTMDFINEQLPERKVLIHCNQGLSRSTSIGLVYLARHGIIANDDLESAATEFIKLYPDYQPGNGVKLYTKNNWDYLMRWNS